MSEAQHPVFAAFNNVALSVVQLHERILAARDKVGDEPGAKVVEHLGDTQRAIAELADKVQFVGAEVAALERALP